MGVKDRRLQRRALLASGVFGAGLWGVSTALGQNSPDMETKEGAPSPDLGPRALGVDMSKLPRLSPEDEDRAKAVGKEVVCLCGTCPRHTITDCQCGWAHQQKKAIRLAMESGQSGEQIIAAYRRVFGDKVLAMIPDEGFARTSYALPYAAAVLGLAAVIWVGIRSLRRGGAKGAEASAPEPAADAADADVATLRRELEDLD